MAGEASWRVGQFLRRERRQASSDKGGVARVAQQWKGEALWWVGG